MDASNESPDVQGKVYAAFILDREHINAKPLFAALLKLDKADGVAYKKIETAVQLSGYSFRTNIVLEENDTLPRETVVASMQLWIDDRQQRFEKKFKTTLAIPVPSLKSGFVSGLSFMEKAAAIGLIKMEIVARCRLLKDPAISSRLPPSTLPKLPSPAGASSLPPPGVVQGDLVLHHPPAPEPAFGGSLSKSGQLDIFASAMEESGLDEVLFAVDQIAQEDVHEEVVEGDGGDGDSFGEEEGVEVDGMLGDDTLARVDLDRAVEDALHEAECLVGAGAGDNLDVAKVFGLQQAIVFSY